MRSNTVLIGNYDVTMYANGTVVKALHRATPRVDPTHRTRFRTSVFLSDVLTTEEADDLLASTNSVLKKVIKRMTLPNRNAFISVDNPEFILVIGVFLSENIVDQTRHDELLLGVPI